LEITSISIEGLVDTLLSKFNEENRLVLFKECLEDIKGCEDGFKEWEAKLLSVPKLTREKSNFYTSIEENIGSSQNPENPRKKSWGSHKYTSIVEKGKEENFPPKKKSEKQKKNAEILFLEIQTYEISSLVYYEQREKKRENSKAQEKGHVVPNKLHLQIAEILININPITALAFLMIEGLIEPTCKSIAEFLAKQT